MVVLLGMSVVVWVGVASVLFFVLSDFVLVLFVVFVINVAV